MAWTATVTSVTTQGGNIEVLIAFADGAKRFNDKVVGDNITLERLQQWAANRIASLNSRDTAQTNLNSLVGQSLTPVDPPADPPALKELRKQASRIAVYRRLGGNNFSTQIAAALAIIESILAANPEWIDDRLLPR